jgi:hypothetical protein
MKRRILLTCGFLGIVGIAIAAITLMSHVYKLPLAIKGMSETEVDRFLQLTKEPGRDWWAGKYDGEIERGILVLKNGEIVRFAFISHHVSKDGNSHSYFQGNKYRKYVTGWFCCEVEFFRQQQPKDIAELDFLLSKYDGVSP